MGVDVASMALEDGLLGNWCFVASSWCLDSCDRTVEWSILSSAICSNRGPRQADPSGPAAPPVLSSAISSKGSRRGMVFRLP
jgi:hypothetical protein